jgi:hypothetical protein
MNSGRPNPARATGRRGFFVAEALLGLAVLTLVAAAGVAAIRWHMRAIGIDALRNQALLAVEQSLEQIRSPSAPQSTTPATTITIDPALAPSGYHWIQARAGTGNRSASLVALVPNIPAPSRAGQ